MILRRPKIPAIYNQVQGWWNNGGNIQYRAHAIIAGPAAISLGNTLAIAAGGGPAQHPDQQYWLNAVAAPHGTIRIEIDCTLMPCGTEFNGCLFQVPRLMRQAGFANIDLRIFSHRDEGLGGNVSSSKRYIACNSSDNNGLLIEAMNEQDGWGWVPWVGTYDY